MVTITVAAVNDNPIANNDSYDTNEDTTLNVPAPGALSNDTDVEGNPLTAIVVTNPLFGSLTLNPDGSFVYSPNPNFYGTDSFTYKANDEIGDSNVAMVTLTVNPVIDPRVANNDSYTTPQDTPLTVSAPGILGNDTDVDGDSLTAILVNGPAHAISFTLNPDGSFSYTPVAKFNGTDSFTYKAYDGLAYSEIATVTLTVVPPAVPSPPVLSAPGEGAVGISTTPTLSWNASPGADSYGLQVSLDPAFSSTVIDLTGIISTSYTISIALIQNTTYHWRVNATNTGGTSGWPSTWSFTTVCPVPGSFSYLSPPNGATNQSRDVDLDWQDASRATSYDVYFGTTNPPPFTVNKTTSDCDPGMLVYGTTYYWKVVAKNTCGETPGQSGQIWSFVTVPCPTPETPSNPSPAHNATGVATNPTFSWNATSNTDSYDVYFGTFSPPPFVGNTTSASYPLPGLNTNTTYYWKVIANNSCGNSTSGVEWNFTTIVATPPAPTLASPADNGTGISISPALSWNASTGAVSYRLQLSTDPLFATVIDQSGITGTSQPASGLANNILYYWRVNATNAGGTSGWSDVWHFTTIVAAPPAPNLAVPANNATGVAVNPALSWNAPIGAVSYRLQVSTDPLFATVIDQSGITGTSQPVSGLANNILYYWRVNATNAGGTSGWSTAWSFTTIVAAPSAPILAAPLNAATGVATNPTLSWIASTGAISYQLQVASNDTFSTTVFDQSGITGTLQPVSGLSNYTPYWWRVRATNTEGTSPWSEFWSFTTIGLPEMTVLQDGIPIADDTGIYDFGSVNVRTSSSATFTIENLGSGALNLIGSPIVQISGLDASDFTVIADETARVTAGGSTNFVIQFTPGAVGSRTAMVSISNTDSEKNPYNFSIIGTGAVDSFPFTDDFRTDKGWTGYATGGWKREPAVAGGGTSGNPDPAIDHSHTDDNYILGFAIGGDYPNGLSDESITSPPIDCSDQDQVFLKFWRYLNVGAADHAGIYVSNDGTSWYPVWENPGDVTDAEWAQVTYDISLWAAHEETVYIRFTMGPTDSSQSFSGWNIDDLEVTSGYSISGFVRTKTGAPVRGVLVCFEDRTNAQVRPCVETDWYGFYVQYAFEPYDRTKKNTIYVIPNDPDFKFSPKKKAFKIKTQDINMDFRATLLTR